MEAFPFDPTLKKKKKAKEAADAALPEQPKEYSFDETIKKKKKKGTKTPEEDVSLETQRERDEDYRLYLERIFDTLRRNNQEKTDKKEKIIMACPKIERDGAKKTAFVNIVEISKRMRRQTDHLVAYLLSELGTTGTIDGSQRLIIKGIFREEQIMFILKKYIKEYVRCKNCKSSDTQLEKENRLFFVKCISCGASQTVTMIKTGFLAQTAKRSSMRK
ncbi:MAG: translation initiation factor eIF2 subunit beta [Amphiamblys sp. WSBS2006]|nr:MAG: translation initiation factor eIF2 subunit beta [Amphiamblys sp. WSBS2006]